MTTQERLRLYLSLKHLTVKAFEDCCGLSNGSVSKMNGKVRQTTLSRIAMAFPDLNTEWLATGAGDMLLPPARPGSNNIQSDSISNSSITQTSGGKTAYTDIVRMLRRECEIKDTQIAELLRQVSERDRQIANLIDIVSKSCKVG